MTGRDEEGGRASGVDGKQVARAEGQRRGQAGARGELALSWAFATLPPLPCRACTGRDPDTCSTRAHSGRGHALRGAVLGRCAMLWRSSSKASDAAQPGTALRLSE